MYGHIGIERKYDEIVGLTNFDKVDCFDSKITPGIPSKG